MPTVLWFRRDLRLADHPALLAATRDGEPVVPLFVVDPRLVAAAGAPRLGRLASSLRALDKSLDGTLVLRTGAPEVVVPAVAREVEATEVHVSASTEPYGRRRDAAVETSLDVPLVRTGSPYAVAPGRLRTQQGTPYTVFTPFRRAWERHGWSAPAAPAGAVTWERLSGDGWAALPRPDDGGVPGDDEGGERAAGTAWDRFVDGALRDYATDRDRPDRPGTSRLSAALKLGEVHPRTLLARLEQVVAADPELAAAAEVFTGQLAWREFHADVLWHRPEAAHRSLRAVVHDEAWARGADADAAFAAWAAGRTGYPLVDAGMRQLAETGWMHNRVRMVTASFLVKDLHLDWRRGAAHFMTQLVDGDVAQNQLNWQWVAGTGFDAAPYFRVLNPVTQSQRFDPDGAYVRRWVPELRDVPAPAVHQPWTLGERAPGDYPAPMVDHATERRAALEAYGRGR
ncbi:deoxyribodipyrimidine photo-lyase [Cellulomonas sp. NTE-D12]|uniref:cryptochrome/photolyase family protein n=1 Tax=Cellulomonas sp. NTE-D12 TaxID=2962632 RepID=UPI0030816816|nr:deoxyribodipyrimidine photo-lyase [Cellulomonas sp. NTE-D12]